MNFRKITKKCIVCILCLLLSILLGVLAMTCVYALPTGRMRNNLVEIEYVLDAEGSGYFWAPWQKSARLDGFTDAIMLQNAVYNRQENSSDTHEAHPLEAAMLCSRMEFSENKLTPVESLLQYRDGDRSGHEVSYGRYWHGYLVFLKPLLLLFKFSDIRMMNAAIQLILACAVLLVAYRKCGVRLVLPLGLALLSLNPISTALCMQYSSIYYLMLISVLVMLLSESWTSDKGYLIFLFLGVGTAFFDFLTYPACAVGLCLGVQALMSKASGKDRLLKTVGSGVTWAFGYGGMWGGKWIVGSLITGRNILAEAIGQAQYRSSGEVDAYEGSIQANFTAVVQQNLQVFRNPTAALIVLVLLGVLVWLLATKRCRFAVERASLLSLAIAFAVPFVWYFLLRNHSMVHAWMTHRTLAASVFALSGGLCFGLKGNGSPEN